MRSDFERKIASQLRRNRVHFDYEPNEKPVRYTIEKTYVPDFYVELPVAFMEAGYKPIVIETKGYFPPEDRAKMLAVIESNPGLDIRLVFQNAFNKLNKRSKTTYAEWAHKHGIKCAHERVPLEWIREIRSYYGE